MPRRLARIARAAGYVLATRAAGGRVVRLHANRRVLWAAAGPIGYRDPSPPLFGAGTLALPPLPRSAEHDEANRLRRRTALAMAGGALGSLVVYGASRRTEPGAQKVVGPLGVMVAGGSALIWKGTGVDVELQPFASVVVTVMLYVPAVLKLTDRVVAPLDHRYDTAGLEVRTSGWPPSQKYCGKLVLMVGRVGVLTVTVTGAENAPQPLASVT